jgi:phosphate acetyltransferase
VFFMALPDRVLVYGDCAVNPNPTAEELAEIAIASADTSLAFGIKPRIAMLSYSSGASGPRDAVRFRPDAGARRTAHGAVAAASRMARDAVVA